MVEKDDTTDEAEPLTFAAMMAFATERVKDEVESVDHDVPNHADKLLTARATDLMQTVTNIEMNTASDELETPDDDYVTDAVEDCVVDILLSLGALKHEYDIDITGAFEERMEFYEDYQNFEDALADAETAEGKIEAFEAHMSEHAEGNPMAGGMAGGMANIEPGDNVDNDDYDADDDRDRHFM